MAKDAVLEIRIDNPQARQAFIEFWREMELQGYQYGYEALCNVWVGFDDGRKTLARKIVEVVESASDSYCNCGAVRGVSEHRAICKAVSSDLAERRLRQLGKWRGSE